MRTGVCLGLKPSSWAEIFLFDVPSDNIVLTGWTTSDNSDSDIRNDFGRVQAHAGPIHTRINQLDTSDSTLSDRVTLL